MTDFIERPEYFIAFCLTADYREVFCRQYRSAPERARVIRECRKVHGHNAALPVSRAEVYKIYWGTHCGR